MPPYRVGYFVGSLAKASINRKLAKALVRLAPKELELSEISLGDLPLYSYDYDADFPYCCPSLEAGYRKRRRSALRHSGVQPLDSGRA